MPDINNNGQGNPMNAGYRNTNSDMNSLQSVANNIMEGFQSVKKQFDEIAKALTQQTKENEKTNKLNQNFIRNFTKQDKRNKGINTSSKDISKVLSSLDKQLKLYGTKTRSGKNMSVEAQLSSASSKGYVKELKDLIKEISSQQDYLKGLYKGITSINSDIENMQKEYDSLKGKTDPDSIEKQTELLKRIAEKKDIKKENEDIYNKELAPFLKKLNDLNNQQMKREEQLKETAIFLNEVNSNLRQGYSDLSSISPAFSNFLDKQDRLSKNDQYKEAVNRALEVVSESITQLEEKISSLGDEDSEQREILEKQLKNAQEQEKYLKNLKPIKDNLRTMGTSLKDAGLNLLKGAVTGLKNSLENRYLDTYAEGFQRVYDSVESTRNEISARLRFNQGQFDDMQNNIQAEIKAQGLEGAISLVDVNEAVQGLVAAGITDQETIEKLAFEQAKLKYMGSPFDLQNEGNLSYIMSELNKGTDIDTIVQGFETLSATARTLGEEYGNTMALANGGAQATLSQIFSMGEAAGKSYEQIISDAQDAMTSQMSLASYNVSSDLLTSMLKEIQEQNISSTSPFNQYLLQQGLSADTMRYLSVGEQQDKLVRALQEATDQGGEVPNWLKPLMETWGIGAQYTDIANFLQGAKSQKGIQTSNTPQQQKEIEKLQKEDQEAMQKALYKSQTEKVNTEYENKMTDLAQNAEHFFEGDTVFMTQINNIKTGIDSIIDILTTFAWSSLTGGARGLFSGGASGTSGTGKNLLTGRTVTGGALGVGLGAVEAGTAIYSDLQNGDWETVGKDPNAWRGVGTMVGSLSGNPLVGMAVGEAFAGANRLGNYLGDVLSDMSPTDIQTMKMQMGTGLGDITSLTDFNYIDISNYLIQAAKDLSEAAQEQLNTSNEQLANVKNMSITEKKNLLLQGNYLDEQGNVVDLQMLNSKSEEEINKLFAETVQKDWELQKQKAEYDLKVANWQASSAESRAGMYENIGKYSAKGWGLSEDYGRAEDGTRKMIYNAKTGEGRALTNLEHLFGESNETERRQLFELFNAKPEGMSIDAFIAQNIPEASEDPDIKNFYTQILGLYESNKKIYDEQTKKFLDYWSSAKTKAGTDELGQVWQTYQEMRKEQGQTDFSGIDMDGAFPYIDVQTGLPRLSTGYADLMQPEYYEGRFKSGLSRVPHDNYGAILHEGERVLTKREAEVYNNIIPDIVEAATTEQYFRTDRSSSNVMSTNIYGSSESTLHKDITDQTSSVTSILDKILEAIRSLIITSSTKSGINKNILSMNSDVVQINTSR